MRYVLPSIISALAAAAFAFSQTPRRHSDALELLERVAQHYADAESYDVEWTEERTTTREFYRQWNQTFLIAAEAPENRSHFEGRGGIGGSAMEISDGKTVWVYAIDQGRYTAKPIVAPETAPRVQDGVSVMALFQAKNLRKEWQSTVKRLANAEFHADENLSVDGHTVHCKVIVFRNSDEKRANPNYTYEKKVWIDAHRNVILKTTEQADTFLLSGAGRLPITEVVSVIYSKVKLDGPVSDELFEFRPQSGSREVADFPDPTDSFGSSWMAGDQVPPLKFKASDGTTKSIESFRGKPVLIDFWASWCAPCTASMPHLAEIYKETKSKGLILISVDQDEDAAKATEFLASHGYDWPNFHDGDGAIAKLLPTPGIPHLMLLDAKGIVAYDSTGVDDIKLRVHIAKLGPEFADLTAKPNAAGPCAAVAQPR